MTTIPLEPKIEERLNQLVASGQYPTIADAANRILTTAISKRQVYRTGGDLTVEVLPSDEELATEEWRPVPYGNRYHVSNLGRIRSTRNGHAKYMKPSPINSGHRQVNLSDSSEHKHFLIHRLVALAFLPNPEGKSDVNHIDGNKANNRVSNLEWLTNAENQNHSVSGGIRRLGSAHHKSKLTENDVLIIRKTADESPDSILALSARYGVSSTQIRNIVLRKNWKHLNDANI